MTIILFLVVPLFCCVFGKLLGWAVAAAYFYSPTGNRLGSGVGFWCSRGFPLHYILAVVLGLNHDPAHGVTLFGSAMILDVLGDAFYYGIPTLALFAGAVYVIRDLTLGHERRDTGRVA